MTHHTTWLSTGEHIDINHLNPFWAKCYVYIPLERRSGKLGFPRIYNARFVGYALASIKFRTYYAVADKGHGVRYSKDVVFDDSDDYVYWTDDTFPAEIAYEDVAVAEDPAVQVPEIQVPAVQDPQVQGPLPLLLIAHSNDFRWFGPPAMIHEWDLLVATFNAHNHEITDASDKEFVGINISTDEDMNYYMDQTRMVRRFWLKGVRDEHLPYPMSGPSLSKLDNARDEERPISARYPYRRVAWHGMDLCMVWYTR
jgi:hypothetical protein